MASHTAQSIGVRPCSARKALVRLNGREPKNPRCADSGPACGPAITQWRASLLKAQKKDGGWVLIELGNGAWKREDNKPQSKETDGYAKAYAVHVLTESGVARSDPRLVRGRQWLKDHQRESGRWYTNSPRRNTKHYISHAATNLALLALAKDKEPAK